MGPSWALFLVPQRSLEASRTSFGALLGRCRGAPGTLRDTPGTPLECPGCPDIDFGSILGALGASREQFLVSIGASGVPEIPKFPDTQGIPTLPEIPETRDTKSLGIFLEVVRKVPVASMLYGISAWSPSHERHNPKGLSLLWPGNA